MPLSGACVILNIELQSLSRSPSERPGRSGGTRRGGMMFDFGLRDRVIAVTGGASGIGRAVCLQAARAGANVAVVDTTAPAAEKVVEEVKQLGRSAIAEVFDVRDGTKAEAAVQRIEKALGPVDGMVASAG